MMNLNEYTGKSYPGYCSWLLRVNFNKSHMKLSPIDKRSESILLTNEHVYSVLEFGINQLLVSVQLTDLLILDSW